MNGDAPLPVIDPGQQSLPGMGPSAGQRWRHRKSGTIAAVVGLEQRTYGWVTIRMYGALQTITTASFLRTFERI